MKATFTEPMLLLPARTSPEGANCAYELKLDGYRALAIKTFKTGSTNERFLYGEGSVDSKGTIIQQILLLLTEFRRRVRGAARLRNCLPSQTLVSTPALSSRNS